jgi:hypothetical protein
MQLQLLKVVHIADKSVIRQQFIANFAKVWLLIACGLAMGIVIEDWASSVYAGFGGPAVIATVIAFVITRAVGFQQPSAALTVAAQARPSHLPRHPLPAAELALAVEHIQSIRVLLEVSSSHDQPVPRAVLVNLQLVLKSLRKLAQSCPGSTENGVTTTPGHSSPSGVGAER